MYDISSFSSTRERQEKAETLLKFFEKFETEDPTKLIPKNEPIDLKFLKELSSLRPPTQNGFVKGELNDKLFMFSQVDKHSQDQQLMQKFNGANSRKRKEVAIKQHTHKN